MSTRIQLRTALRELLDDAGTPTLWSDTLLNDWLAQGIRRYSLALPRQLATSLTSVANQAAYALPADALPGRPLRLEYPPGAVWRQLPDRYPPLTAPSSSQEAVGGSFAVQAGQIMLTEPLAVGGASLALGYAAYHSVPAADGDSPSVPDADESLLLDYAAHRAWLWLATMQAKRAVWESGGLPNAAAVRASQQAAEQHWARFAEGLRARQRQAISL